MRRRLVISTIAIVLVVLGTLAVPVGLIVYHGAEEQLDARLEQQASSIADAIGPDLMQGRLPAVNTITELLGPLDGFRIFDPDGAILLESVPRGVDSTRNASRRTPDGSRVVVLTDVDPLDEQFRSQLNILLILALGAITGAAGLAAVQAHQLARPLERLATRAARIGAGDFSLQPLPRTQIPEIDRIGSTLDASAQSVGQMLSTERHFTADATHQLRTGLTGIAMRFEVLRATGSPDVVAEAEAGLAQTQQMSSTIDELLALARDRSSRERQVFDLTGLLRDHVEEWIPRFNAQRRLISLVVSVPSPPVFGTKGLAGQIIDILIDNSLNHGAGTVTLLVDGPAVTIIDQGPGMDPEAIKRAFDGPVDPAAKHGRGLSLARRLAQVDGGRLEIVGNRPLRVRYQLVLGDHGPAIEAADRGLERGRIR